MKKNHILAFGSLALVLSVSSFAVGAGALSLNRNEAVAVKAEGNIQTTYVHGDMNGLTSTATTADTSVVSEDGIEYVFSEGAKTNSASGSNKLAADKSAVLIGKAGTYIYNKTPFGTGITSFKIYANKGASAKVSVGVYFSVSAITEYSSSAAQYSATLSKVDSVYDLTSEIPEGAKYFWYQVTNSNNSQVQFEISYKASEEPSIFVADGSSIALEPSESADYSLVTSNLPEGTTFDVSVADASIAEVSLNEDSAKLVVAAKSIGNTTYVVSAKDSTGSVIASFSGSISVANVPVKVTFGSATGSWNFNSASSTFKDSKNVVWTGTASGTTSFTPNDGYAQIGSSSKPANSISAEGTLGGFYSIDSISGVFGGFSGTQGSVSLKAGSAVIGTGSLNGTNNVVVSSTSSAFADSLSFEITGISKGVKLISLEYSVSSISETLIAEVDAFVATFITPYSGAAVEGDSCKTKYENAATAYDTLSEKGKQLFGVHTKYAEAKRVYEYWGESVNPTNAKGSPLSAFKTADWASMSSVGFIALSGIFVAGLFLVNKKKAE